MITERLFVYGTLKTGLSNSRMIGPAIKTGENWLEGFELWTDRYPYILKVKDKKKKVFGEIYKVPQDYLFNQLDRFEGCPQEDESIKDNPYAYQRIWIKDQHNGIWTYTRNNHTTEERKLIENGIYIE